MIYNYVTGIIVGAILMALIWILYKFITMEEKESDHYK